MLPKVHNKKAGTAPLSAVYIGRPSVYGNPFPISSSVPREVVIRRYAQWVCGQPPLIAQIKHHLAGKDLVCFCKPEACHGDVLLLIANDPYLYFSLPGLVSARLRETDTEAVRLQLRPISKANHTTYRIRFSAIDLARLNGEPSSSIGSQQMSFLTLQDTEHWSQTLLKGAQCTHRGPLDVSKIETIAHEYGDSTPIISSDVPV